jgi:hypothetical protein
LRSAEGNSAKVVPSKLLNTRHRSPLDIRFRRERGPTTSGTEH